MPMQIKGRVTGDDQALESLKQMRLMHVLQAENSKRLLRDIESGKLKDRCTTQEQLTTLLINVLKGQIDFDTDLAVALEQLTATAASSTNNYMRDPHA